MGAHSARRLCFAASFTLIFVLTAAAQAAQFKTTNFQVAAPTPELAREIGETAEKWRRELSIEWIGQPMPDWSRPCPIRAEVAPGLGAGGMTTFVFDRGEVFDWNMQVSGSRERVLDSVLPHEITHTIFACHFRQPLPRWADEGACTTVEHPSEIGKQEDLLIRFLKSGRGIRFSDLFAMKEYPQDVLPLYAHGHSLTRFLIGQHGKEEFLEFLADGMSDENWPRAVSEHYGHDSLFALQNSWLNWVRKGRPLLAGELEPRATLASAEPRRAEVRPLVASSQESTSHESAYSRAARAKQSQQQAPAAALDPRSGGVIRR